MTPPGPTATQVAQLDEARRIQDLVLAENSLRSVRWVFGLRLLMTLGFGLSTFLAVRVVGLPYERDPIRAVAVVVYLAAGVASLIGTLRARPNVRAARVMPYVSIALDFGFGAFMTWRDGANGYFASDKLAIVLAVFTCFSISYYSLWHVATATAAAMAIYVTAYLQYGEFAARTVPIVCVAFAALGFLIGRSNVRTRGMFVSLRKRDNLSRFLPRQVAERVLAGGEAALRPIQREVTVMFSDIRDFTSLSEDMSPRATLELLDVYLGHMAAIVKGHDGVVNKFLGDGMLAFWGVPDEDPRHAQKAIDAALDMRIRLVELNQVREREGQPPIRFGIGIHTGVVAAGMLGGAEQAEYTIIGDAVNVASRVEGLNRRLDTDILVTDATWSIAGDAFQGTRQADAEVKGKRAPVVVYAVAGHAARHK